VKGVSEKISGTNYRKGIVTEVSAEQLTLIELHDNGKVVEHQIVPINVLSNGEILPRVDGMFAYRWGDVKKGDTVELDVKTDKSDGVVYCLQICIHCRPGAKLPESQCPKGDRYFLARQVYNDIDNGLDVSDEELKKAFPSQFNVDPKTGEKRPGEPGVKYMEYMKKLDAIRSKKKEAELKASPPDKKK
jgi:hypothetical protein